MIRRISKHNDLKDLIKSCPSGVIDDIYAIEYYIQGYNTVIQASFTKKETMLEVILPSIDLETLPNGILMRRAYYKVVDASYPDGYYNLEFEDNMNVWLGEVESEEPVIPEYVTEEELAETLGDYATQEWVEDKGYITTSALSGYATESWVGQQGYITSASLSGYATESWVENKGYITSVALSGYATQSWVENQGYITSAALSGYATQDWVEQQGYVTSSALSGYATESYVQNQGYITSSALSGYATQDWVGNQGYITSSALSGYATETWVGQQGYVTSSAISNCVQYDEDIPFSSDDNKVISVLDVYSYGTLTIITNDEEGEHVQYDGIKIDNTGTINKYSANNIEDPGTWTEYMDPYVTESWVGNQGYITSSALSGYATQSWATNQFLEESKVWTGTEAQWNQLSASQKSSYTIALITQ